MSVTQFATNTCCMYKLCVLTSGNVQTWASHDVTWVPC
jgi:hypothetical protein